VFALTKKERLFKLICSQDTIARVPFHTRILAYITSLTVSLTLTQEFSPKTNSMSSVLVL